MLTKEWYCANCGRRFRTPWLPSMFVVCPFCGSRRVYRVDARRGRGYGPRYRRGICR